MLRNPRHLLACGGTQASEIGQGPAGAQQFGLINVDVFLDFRIGPGIAEVERQFVADECLHFDLKAVDFRFTDVVDDRGGRAPARFDHCRELLIGHFGSIGGDIQCQAPVHQAGLVAGFEIPRHFLFNGPEGLVGIAGGVQRNVRIEIARLGSLGDVQIEIRCVVGFVAEGETRIHGGKVDAVVAGHHGSFVRRKDLHGNVVLCPPGFGRSRPLLVEIHLHGGEYGRVVNCLIGHGTVGENIKRRHAPLRGRERNDLAVRVLVLGALIVVEPDNSSKRPIGGRGQPEFLREVGLIISAVARKQTAKRTAYPGPDETRQERRQSVRDSGPEIVTAIGRVKIAVVLVVDTSRQTGYTPAVGQVVVHGQRGRDSVVEVPCSGHGIDFFGEQRHRQVALRFAPVVLAGARPRRAGSIGTPTDGSAEAAIIVLPAL